MNELNDYERFMVEAISITINQNVILMAIADTSNFQLKELVRQNTDISLKTLEEAKLLLGVKNHE